MNLNCEIDQKTLQCKLCGFQFRKHNAKKNCPKKLDGKIVNITVDNNIEAIEIHTKNKKTSAKTNKNNKLLSKIKNFSIAAIKHAIKGNPTCTQEEIDKRHSICLQCNDFVHHVDENGNKTDVGHCRDCGCNVNKVKKYLNKLAWADQKCPQDKW